MEVVFVVAHQLLAIARPLLFVLLPVIVVSYIIRLVNEMSYYCCVGYFCGCMFTPGLGPYLTPAVAGRACFSMLFSCCYCIVS